MIQAVSKLDPCTASRLRPAMRVAGVAAWYQVSRTTIRAWLRSGLAESRLDDSHRLCVCVDQIPLVPSSFTGSRPNQEHPMVGAPRIPSRRLSYTPCLVLPPAVAAEIVAGRQTSIVLAMHTRHRSEIVIGDGVHAVGAAIIEACLPIPGRRPLWEWCFSTACSLPAMTCRVPQMGEVAAHVADAAIEALHQAVCAAAERRRIEIAGRIERGEPVPSHAELVGLEQPVEEVAS